jgi:hypothetical protein
MSGKPVFLDLQPDAVRAFVFWTRNPKPLIKHLDYIDDRYNKMHYMHITINGPPEVLEERNPKVSFVIRTIEELNKRYGPDYVQWRFDPIILSSVTTEKDIIEIFKNISQQLNGLTKRCYFSFVDLYKKTERNFNLITQKHGIKFHETSLKDQIDLTKILASIASENGIAMYACAEDQIIEQLPFINKAHCVDADIIQSLSADHTHINYKLDESRIGCGCFESRDIGYYNSCPHGCIYCYANMDPQIALTNAKNFITNGFPLDGLKYFA